MTRTPAIGGALLASGLAICAGVALSQSSSPLTVSSAEEVAGIEDYRTAVGRLVDGELHVVLVARPAGWQPWGEAGPTLASYVFAAGDAAPKVPGPMLRVAAGTPVRVAIRNTLSDTLLVRGLRDRDQQPPPGVQPGALAGLAFAGDSLVVAPGETAEVRFTPTVPGSYFYYGKTFAAGWSATPQPLFGARAEDRGLVGVLIVDPPDETPDPAERIFLITQWADGDLPASFLPAARFMINGRSWPHTERLTYVQGDTIRWRVINNSGANHPMHLHGFYFHVDEWTAQAGGAMTLPVPRPEVVTWPLPSTTALRMTWVAHEPGNWLFHCHLMRHMSWIQAPPSIGGASPDAHAHHGSDADGIDLLGGMVLGITVTPAAGHVAAAEPPARRLRLHIGMRPNVFGDEPAYGFVLQEGGQAPSPDSVHFPGSTLLLTRGEPTEIVVLNHADVPLGVHWHGLELESRADGVPGWSGSPGRVVPAIAPGDSLAVRMTPRRAGTFMYHVHSEPGHQLAQGLYGAFLVTEPGAPWDPETDRLFLLGSLGGGEDSPPAVNGQHEPEPMDFVAGTTHRLRFMHISPDESKAIQLLDGERPVLWQHAAIDGADLPVAALPARPANMPFFDVGKTSDMLWTPERPGEYTLRIVTTFDSGLAAFPRPSPPPHTQDIVFRVR